ncbi:HTH domain-containing protein [Rhodobacteraceae bacterium CCMM004]|nr:HTH domain-containing protein [Rhodobacteraceae bacterium CCMM004]
MRAARILHMLLLLQNRGRMTCGALAAELEVSRRTVLRDLDALTEAGLPVIVHQGARGGVELGFDYRLRLAALDADEAVAMGLILGHVPAFVAAIGLGPAARRAQAKLFEAFSDRPRARMAAAQAAFADDTLAAPVDARVPALARAVRECRRVRLRAFSDREVEVAPVGLSLTADGWTLGDDKGGSHAQDAWGRINISAPRPG